MFKNVFTRFRSKKPMGVDIDKNVLFSIYILLHHTRLDIVDGFYHIKNRKLRELYDNYAFMMIKLDKTIQFLRRILNEDLYTRHDRLKDNEINEIIAKLPIEISAPIRNLVQNARLLKEFTASLPSPYINSVIKNVSDMIDSVAGYLDNVIH